MSDNLKNCGYMQLNKNRPMNKFLFLEGTFYVLNLKA